MTAYDGRHSGVKKTVAVEHTPLLLRAAFITSETMSDPEAATPKDATPKECDMLHPMFGRPVMQGGSRMIYGDISFSRAVSEKNAREGN